jgi:hypothetical protein
MSSHHLTAVPSPERDDEAAPDRFDRVLHYELPWTRYAWCTLRRPSPQMLAYLVWFLLLVGTIVALRTTELRHGFLGRQLAAFPAWLVTVLTMLVAIAIASQLWSWLRGSWTANGGHDRVALIRGSELKIGMGAGARTYDLARAQRTRLGGWVRLRAPTRRWHPDDVPAQLLDGVDVERRVERRPAEASEAVIITTWRDALADSLASERRVADFWSSWTSAVLLGVAISHHALAIGLGMWLVIGGVRFTVEHLVSALRPISDSFRGIAVRATEHGLLMRDDGYVETVRWSSLIRPTIDHDRIRIPPYGIVRRRAANAARFDELARGVEAHAANVQDARVAPVEHAMAASIVRRVLRAATMLACVGAVALQIHAPDRYVRLLVDFASVPIVLVALLVLVRIGTPLVQHAAIRPPDVGPAHRRAPTVANEDDDADTWTLRDLRLGVLMIAAVPALVFGGVLLATRDMQLASIALGIGAALALAGWQLLPDLHREVAFTVATGVFAGVTASCFLLATMLHPAMTMVVGGVVAGSLFAIVALGRQLDGDILPPATLGSGVIWATVAACVVGGAASLVVVDRTRIDITNARAVLHHPVIAATPLRGVRLADAYRDAEVVRISWHGDDPRVTSPTGLFDGADGALAQRRIETILREAAREPGPRPRLRELVFPTSWYGVASHNAINKIRNAGPLAQWPGSASDWIRAETKENDWRSEYYGEPRRIVMSRHQSEPLLDVLGAPPGEQLDYDQSIAIRIMRHEIEHGMSANGHEPQWIVEATAEVLPQWEGRQAEVYRAAGFESDYWRTEYQGAYEHWSRLLFTLLESCELRPDEPTSFDRAATLLHDPHHLVQDQLASCIATKQHIDRGGLSSLIARAGSSKGAERELLARLEAAP